MSRIPPTAAAMLGAWTETARRRPGRRGFRRGAMALALRLVRRRPAARAPQPLPSATTAPSTGN